VFTFSDVMHFFTDELAGLRARRLSFSFGFSGSLDGFRFWHDYLLVLLVVRNAPTNVASLLLLAR
jgi:hypothetical protein